MKPIRRPIFASLVLVASCLVGCATAAPPADVGPPRLDRSEIREQVSTLLDDYEWYRAQAGDEDAAKRIHEAREVAKAVLDAVENGSDLEVENRARQLDRVVNAAIGLIPDGEKRFIARGGYFVIRQAVKRAGVTLSVDPPAPAPTS